MKYRLSAAARRDLRDVAEFYGDISADTAHRVRDDIEATLAAACEFPRMYPKRSRDGLRKAVTEKYRYVLIYSVGESVIDVIAVFREQDR